MPGMRTRALPVLMLILAALLLAGCPPRESIARINRDPGRFAGKEISIAGRVTDSFGALGTGAFQIDDGTGTMWVFSEKFGIPGNGCPPRGHRTNSARLLHRRPQFRHHPSRNPAPPLTPPVSRAIPDHSWYAVPQIRKITLSSRPERKRSGGTLRFQRPLKMCKRFSAGKARATKFRTDDGRVHPRPHRFRNTSKIKLNSCTSVIPMVT